MTTKDAAELWECSVETVRDYCRKGYINNLRRGKRGNYIIPENARRPYVATTNTQTGAIKAILRAIDGRYSLNHNALHMSKEELETYIQYLISNSYVVVSNNALVIEEAGRQLLDQNWKKACQIITATFTALAAVAPYISMLIA